ncbi:hypothetical protein ACN28S_39215 [Cystobacter fuscus]
MGVNTMEMQGLLDPLLGRGVLAADNLGQRQRNFRDLCAEIGGSRGTDLQVNFAGATPHTLGNVSPTPIAEFEELYWNNRPVPGVTHRLYGEADDTPPPQPVAPVRLRRTNSSPGLSSAPLARANRTEPDRLAEFRASLVALLRTDHPGHQYCFDYLTYGPLLTTNDENGNPNPISARACLTPLRRTRADLHSLSDTLLTRLEKECGSGTKKYYFTNLKRLVVQSSAGPLSPQDIDSLRTCARSLRDLL